MSNTDKSKYIKFSLTTFCQSLEGKKVDIHIHAPHLHLRCTRPSTQEIRSLVTPDLIPLDVLNSIVIVADDFISPQLLNNIVEESEQDRNAKKLLVLFDPLIDPFEELR